MQKILSAIDKNCERWLLLGFYSMIVVTIGTEVVFCTILFVDLG